MGCPGGGNHIRAAQDLLILTCRNPIKTDAGHRTTNPPYLHETRKDLELYQYEMSDQDHVELLECLASLPCMVMVSGYDSQLYNDMLSGRTTHVFTAQTRRGPAREKIRFNYPPPGQLHDYSYVGETYRRRHRFKTKKQRWINRLIALPPLKRNAMFQALSDAISQKGS